MYMDNDQRNRIEAFGQLSQFQGELIQSAYIPETDLPAYTAAVGLQGRMLEEGPNGTGKTTIAEAIGVLTAGTVGIVQGTPDVMPADITGARVWDEESKSWRFDRGPIFSNLLFVDEANRMSPKTQSAFLQGMQSEKVTPAGDTVTHDLPKPFMVIATQNPKDKAQGTNPMPMAQLDRFDIVVQSKPIDQTAYNAIRKTKDHTPREVMAPGVLRHLPQVVERFPISPEAEERAVNIVLGLRNQTSVIDLDRSMLHSFRGMDQTVRYARAFALLETEGKGHATKRHVDMAAQFTLPHRIHLNYDARENNTPVAEVIDHVTSHLG